MKILNILVLVFTLILLHVTAQADSNFKNMLLATQSEINQENKVLQLVQADNDYIVLKEEVEEEAFDEDETFEDEEDDGC